MVETPQKCWVTVGGGGAEQHSAGTARQMYNPDSFWTSLNCLLLLRVRVLNLCPLLEDNKFLGSVFSIWMKTFIFFRCTIFGALWLMHLNFLWGSRETYLLCTVKYMFLKKYHDPQILSPQRCFLSQRGHGSGLIEICSCVALICGSLMTQQHLSCRWLTSNSSMNSSDMSFPASVSASQPQSVQHLSCSSNNNEPLAVWVADTRPKQMIELSSCFGQFQGWIMLISQVYLQCCVPFRADVKWWFDFFSSWYKMWWLY